MKPLLRLFILLLGWMACRPPGALAQTCAPNPSTLDFSSADAAGDWKTHAPLAVPTGSTTTVSSGSYTSSAAAASTTFTTAAVNSVTSLRWATDYTSTANNTTTVVFTFSQVVNNFTVTVQDIDKAETNGNAFIDQVTFAGADATGIAVTSPTLTKPGTSTVAINGAVATGTTNVANATDGNVTATFTSGIKTLTLTYRNTSTVSSDPTNNVVGISNMTWCRAVPTANNITNASVVNTANTAAVNNLSGTAEGPLTYVLGALPSTAQGTLYVNGVAAASGQTLTAVEATQLSFSANPSFVGIYSFSYTDRDNGNNTSNTATYSVPVTGGTTAPCASPGKDGAGVLTANPNTYYPGTATTAASATSISVGTARGGTAIGPNDLLLVIQMQGADINTSNSNAYGDGVAGDPANGYLSTGLTAGQYEYVVASGAVTGGVVNITTPLKNIYTASGVGPTATLRTFQVVRVPQYTTLTLNANISPLFWNGSTGGVTAVDVQGLMAFGAFRIDASALGFRGGAGIKQTYPGTPEATRTDYLNTAASTRNAQKGEGIAGSPQYVNYVNGVAGSAYTFLNTTVDNYPGGSSGRGAPANAGGGGNDNGNNSGGGGGANAGTGGHGGYSSVTVTPNNTNSTTTSYIGGEPGGAFTASNSGRLIMGGGGGAGTTNDGTGGNNGFVSSGTPGGGIVIVRAGTVSGSSGSGILANGGNVPTGVQNDGGGGAGAGGAILLTVTGSQAGLASLTLSATGGNGGSVNPGGANNGSTAHGPGGGGGGGVVFTTSATATTLAVSTAGGANGTTTPAGAGTGYVQSAFGATAGTTGSGQSNASISNSIANSASGAVCSTISGTIFDDVNYGGGAGRPYSTANTFGSAGTAVELYNSTGALAGTTTTAADGTYSFTGLASGTYTVRVVNSTVKSGRTPGATGLVPVQTFRTTARTAPEASAATADVNRVGGEAPEKQDANANTGTQTLAALTAGTATPQSIASVTTGTLGVDFGYNFDVVTNTNDAGQGSLRQFITNANALGNEAILAQSGSRTDVAGAPVALAVGTESSIFMIPNGATSNVPAGLRSGLVSGLTNGVAAIAPATALPTITGANTSIDGTTQTFNIGNTNNVALGTGGTVGTANTAFAQVNGPEVQIKGTAYSETPLVAPITSGLAIAANTSNTSVRGLSIYGFGTGILGGLNATGTRIEQNVVGASAISFTDPGVGVRNRDEGINLNDSDNGFVTNNLVGFNGGMGIWVQTSGANGNNGANNNAITGNEIRGNALVRIAGNGERLVFDGLELQGKSTGNTVQGNLITANTGHGIDSFDNIIGGNTVTGNTISNNGVGVANNTGEEGSGLRVFGANNPTLIANNVLTGNNGSGVLVLGLANQVTISQNSISGNTRLGIDLLSTAETNLASQTAGTTFWNGATGTTPNATLNDNGDGDTGGNGLLNFPVLTTATLTSTTLVVNGYARPGSLVELFLATPLTTDPTNAGANTTVSNRNFGQGSSFLVGRTEGNATDDSNTGTGTYGVANGGLVNGVNQGTDNTNQFTFTIPLSSLTAAQQTALLNGSVLTSTATLANSTSEFSANLSLPVVDVTTVLAGPLALNAGQPSGNFTVTYTNNGPSVATGVTQQVTLPAGVTNVVVTTGATYNALTRIIDFGTATTLNNGATNTFTYSFTAPTTTGSVMQTSNVTTTANQVNNTAPDASSFTSTVNPVADVATTISAANATVTAGTTGTFNVAFKNNGPSPAAGPVAQVQLPVGLQGVVVTASNGATGTYDGTTGVVTYSGITSPLPSGTTITSSIAFTVPASGAVTATSSINTTTSELGRTTDNAFSATITATPVFDVVTNITGPATTVAGTLVTYSLVTTNNGPSTATAIGQGVKLPAGLTNVFISNGGTYNSTTGDVTFPSLATLVSGAQVNNTISFVAPATTASPISAVATITGDTNAAGNTSTATTTISAASTTNANIYTTISANQNGTVVTNVLPGSAVVFTVVSGNNGPNAATGVVQRVSLPKGLTGVTITGPNGVANANYDANTGVVTLPVVASLASAGANTYTITVNAPASGVVAAAASISATTNDIVVADNVATADVTVNAPGDVATTLTGPKSVGAGQDVTYTVTTANNGLVPAANVVQTVTIPAGLLTVTITGSGTYNASTGVVTFPTIASQASGSSVVNSISYSAPAAASLLNVASVSTASPDNVRTNNRSAVTTTVDPIVDVTVAISGPPSIVQGNQIDYAVVVTNNGPSIAPSVATQVQIPAGLGTSNVVLSTGGSYNNTTGLVTFTAITNQLVGAAGTVTNVVRIVAAPIGLSQINATATVSVGAAVEESNYTNNVASVITPASAPTTVKTDLFNNVTVSPTVPNAGDAVTLTVTTSNLNSSTGAATNVVQRVALDAGLTISTISGGGTYDPITGVVTFPAITSLAVGATTVNTITLVASGTTPLQARAFVSGDQSDPTPGNNQQLRTITVTPLADVATFVSGPTTVAVGDAVTYSVLTLNNGPSPASTVIQKVVIPSGLSAASVTISGGGTYDSSTGTVTFPTIATQDAGAGGQVMNSISFTAPSTTYTVAGTVTTTTTQPSTTTATNNNSSTVTVAPGNTAPVANAVVNSLQTPEGNTAGALLLSPLSATDANGNGTIASYRLTSIPDAATQGVLSLNGTALAVGDVITAANAGSLRFDPLATFVGNAFFNYTATDNAGVVSAAPAVYTIPVGQDNGSFYAMTPAKGSTNKYVTDDVLAYVTDPNGAAYTSTGLLYNAAGTRTNILLGTSGIASVVAAASGSGPATANGAYPANPTNVLPAGVSLDPATGLVYVSNASQLQNFSTARFYQINVVTTDVNGGISVATAQFTIGAYPLPVELTAFTATAVGNRDAALAWATASEKNNDHFDVERSLDGATFVKIGQVKGQGSKSSATEYALTDTNIGAKAAGTVYYRLRQVDTDGTANVSPVRTVSFTKAPVLALGLYPNPAGASTRLDLGQLPAGTYQVGVVDMAGRAVLSASLAGAQAHALDLAPLASGSYVVQVRGTAADGTVVSLSKRLVKE